MARTLLTKTMAPGWYSSWQQPDGKIYLEADNAEVKFGVIAL